MTSIKMSLYIQKVFISFSKAFRLIRMEARFQVNIQKFSIHRKI